MSLAVSNNIAMLTLTGFTIASAKAWEVTVMANLPQKYNPHHYTIYGSAISQSTGRGVIFQVRDNIIGINPGAIAITQADTFYGVCVWPVN